jgi:hypothetical protein
MRIHNYNIPFPSPPVGGPSPYFQDAHVIFRNLADPPSIGRDGLSRRFRPRLVVGDKLRVPIALRMIVKVLHPHLLHVRFPRGQLRDHCGEYLSQKYGALWADILLTRKQLGQKILIVEIEDIWVAVETSGITPDIIAKRSP